MDIPLVITTRSYSSGARERVAAALAAPAELSEYAVVELLIALSASGGTPLERVFIRSAADRTDPALPLAWAQIVATHPEIVSLFERAGTAESAHVTFGERTFPENLVGDLTVAEITAIAREGLVAATRLSLLGDQRARAAAADLSFTALARHADRWFDQLEGFVPAGYDFESVASDIALVERVSSLALGEQEGAVQAALRLAGFLCAEMRDHPAPGTTDSPLATSLPHVEATRALPLLLRRVILSEQGPTQIVFRSLLRGVSPLPAPATP